MIVVRVSNDNITISGHAGYAEKGKDIVCAGVTALAQTLVGAITSLTIDKPAYILDPGVFIIETKSLSEKSKILIDSFFIGICQIIREFPDYIQIQ